jgi:hypothetical protein
MLKRQLRKRLAKNCFSFSPGKSPGLRFLETAPRLVPKTTLQAKSGKAQTRRQSGSQDSLKYHRRFRIIAHLSPEHKDDSQTPCFLLPGPDFALVKPAITRSVPPQKNISNCCVFLFVYQKAAKPAGVFAVRKIFNKNSQAPEFYQLSS